MDENFSKKRTVASGGVNTIHAGEPTKQSTSGNVLPLADGDLTTSQRFTGIAKDESTDTASAAGTINVWTPLPGLLYSAKAKTASLANTQALIDALVAKRVVIDLTSSVYTVDTAAGDATTNGLLCYGGEFQTSTIYFFINPNVSIFANPTT